MWIRRVFLAVFCLVSCGGTARAASEGGASSARVLELRRTLDLESGSAPWASTYENYIVYQADATTILGVDIATGLIRWRYSAGDIPIQSIRRSGKRLIIVAADLQIVELSRGRIEWSYPLGCRRGGRCQLSPVWMSDKWVVLAGFNDAPDSLQVLSLEARSESWPSWAKVGPIGKVSADERMILVANPDGCTVTALDRTVGRVRWTAELPEISHRPPGCSELDRMWSTPEAVHVYRAVTGGRRPSLVFSLSTKDGSLIRTARGALCPSNGSCGAQPADAGVVTFGVPDAGTGRPGHVTIHDLDHGTRPVDDQSYFAAEPLTLAGRVVVLPRRESGQLTIDTLMLPRGRRLWKRSLADVPGPVHLMAAPGVLTVIQESRGLVHGLSLRDGSVQTFGAMDTGDEKIVDVFPCEIGVLVTTAKKLFLFAERPIGELATSLRKALIQGNHAKVDDIDRALVRLAGDLEEAAKAHGLVLVHASLACAAGLARGAEAPAFRRAAELLDRTPSGAVASLVAFSRSFNNVLVDWVVPEPSRVQVEGAGELSRLATVWKDKVESARAALESGKGEIRESVLGMGLNLVEALERTGQSGAAWEVLQALQGLSGGLNPASLTPAVRRIVSRRVAPLSREALALARSGDAQGALDRLMEAASLPLAASVTAGKPELLSEIQGLHGGREGRVGHRTVAHLALQAYKEWGTEPAPDAAMDELACYEVCQRAWTACERPCVSRASCDAANMACVESCEASGRPAWRRPISDPVPTDPAFIKCL